MNRATIAILAVFTLGTLAGPAAAAKSKEFKVIQNAVNHPAASEKVKGHGRDVRWLKVLIRDRGVLFWN